MYKNMKCCENCTCYEEEYEYCFRFGNHAPKDGICDCYREELPKMDGEPE